MKEEIIPFESDGLRLVGVLRYPDEREDKIPGVDHSFQEVTEDEETRLRERMSLESFKRPYKREFFNVLIGGMATSLIRAVLITILFCVVLEIRVGIIDYCGMLAIICLIAIGFGALAIATRMESMDGFGLIVELIVMTIFFLSGAFFPVEGVPRWFSTVVVL